MKMSFTTELLKMGQAKKVLFLTSVHHPFDTRIYKREATSLAKAGYQVTLVASGASSQQTADGINIIGIHKPRVRLGRILNWPRFVKIALAHKANVVHFHDPDLLLIGLLVKLLTGKPVIYDRHENYHQDILAKEWIPKPLRHLVSYLFRLLEKLVADHFSIVIVVVDEHLVYFSNAITVHNYPSLNDFLKLPDVTRDLSKLIYMGGLGDSYGAETLIKMLALLKDRDVCLDWYGNFREDQAESRIVQLLDKYTLGDKFRYWGQIPYDEVKIHLTSAGMGLIALHDIPAFSSALPRKMFEYMVCGLPIVASDLDGIRRVIAGARCGILVKPGDSTAFAQAVTYLLDHPDEAREMGENGRRAVIEKYNWHNEAKKLLELYQNL